MRFGDGSGLRILVELLCRFSSIEAFQVIDLEAWSKEDFVHKTVEVFVGFRSGPIVHPGHESEGRLIWKWMGRLTFKFLTGKGT